MIYLILALLCIPICMAAPEDQYMALLKDDVAYIEPLQTDFYDFGEYTLTAYIENVSNENIVKAVLAATAIYNTEDTPHNVKVYVKDPAGTMIGSAVCYKKWSEDFAADQDVDRFINRVLGTGKIYL